MKGCKDMSEMDKPKITAKLEPYSTSAFSS